MEIQAFIFDLDGVITDTAEYHYLAWKRLADEEGIPFDRQENEKLRGVSRRQSLQILLKDRQAPEEQIQAWMHRKNDYYLEMVRWITPNEVLPGVRDLLNSLRSEGYKIALASASKNAGEVIDRLELRAQFDLVCDGNSVQRTKPNPDLFLFAAKQLAIPPHACVVVEDAASGIAAARAGGFRSIGLGPSERVAEADLILENLADVDLKWLVGQIERFKE